MIDSLKYQSWFFNPFTNQLFQPKYSAREERGESAPANRAAVLRGLGTVLGTAGLCTDAQPSPPPDGETPGPSAPPEQWAPLHLISSTHWARGLPEAGSSGRERIPGPLPCGRSVHRELESVRYSHTGSEVLVTWNLQRRRLRFDWWVIWLFKEWSQINDLNFSVITEKEWFPKAGKNTLQQHNSTWKIHSKNNSTQ